MEIDATYLIESERLVVRPYRDEDAHMYQQFIEGIGSSKMSFTQAAEAVRDKSSMFGPRSTIYLGVFDKVKPVMHSHITLAPYTHRVRSVGYGTQCASQKRGYMSEAFSALADDLINREYLDGLIADVRVENNSSQRVLNTAKFVQDNTRRLRDGWINFKRMAKNI